MNRNLVLRSALAAIAALCVSSFVTADSEPQTTRPVIRGSGNDVTIVYPSKLHPKLSWSAPAPAEAPPAAPAADGPLEQALKMKTSGASDQTVIAFLQKNEIDMPDVVDADTIKDLRRAGAGDAVVALVSRHSAIDIGVTPESAAGPAPQYSDPQEAYTGAFPDLANLGLSVLRRRRGARSSATDSGDSGPRSRRTRTSLFRSGHPFFPKAQPLPAHFSQRMTMSRVDGRRRRARNERRWRNGSAALDPPKRPDPGRRSLLPSNLFRNSPYPL